jgi:hypothetical protein
MSIIDDSNIGRGSYDKINHPIWQSHSAGVLLNYEGGIQRERRSILVKGREPLSKKGDRIMRDE